MAVSFIQNDPDLILNVCKIVITHKVDLFIVKRKITVEIKSYIKLLKESGDNYLLKEIVNKRTKTTLST